ncbi:MAG TPA: type II secretion system protein [Candidatus Saccharimonadales bacterium]|nr:type II secretion system protein [Candidatus Saccharimonadales bacterium]
MISLKRKQSGFTIVELLIVIVVIGILAAIIITTFTGVQKKARDADRKSDINAIYSQVEVYFAQNSKYPTLANLNDGTWRDANVKGLTDDSIHAPNASNALISDLTSTATNVYIYAPTASGGGACDNSATDCGAFTIKANLESGGDFTKTGSNN